MADRDAVCRGAQRIRRRALCGIGALLLRVLAETQPSLDQQIQVFDLLAACYVALGQIELAVGSFGEVLHRRPDFALDPVKTSPKVRAALEQARSRL